MLFSGNIFIFTYISYKSINLKSGNTYKCLSLHIITIVIFTLHLRHMNIYMPHEVNNTVLFFMLPSTIFAEWCKHGLQSDTCTHLIFILTFLKIISFELITLAHFLPHIKLNVSKGEIKVI